MKKSTLLVSVLSLMIPLSAMADWNKTVTTKAEFTAAWATLEGAGSRDTITVDGDNSLIINQGTVTLPTAGKVYIIGTSTDLDNLPQLQIEFNGQDMEENNDFGLYIKNISLQHRSGASASSGQVIYFNKKYCPVDSIVIKDCEITNIPRTLYRSVPPLEKDEEGKEISGQYIDGSTINYFELSGCKVHYINTLSGNNWPLVYLGQSPVELKISNNSFYDMPYCKHIYNMNYIMDPSGYNCDFEFSNNTVAIGSGATSTFVPISHGNYLGVQSRYTICNNSLCRFFRCIG